MADMLKDWVPRLESKEDPGRPFGGKMRDEAWYRRDDGAYERLLMFSVDYIEAAAREPDRWSDGASPEIWGKRGKPDHWITPPPGAKIIDRTEQGLPNARPHHGH